MDRDDVVQALSAFLDEHRRCGELDGGVEEGPAGAAVVRLTCSCGGYLFKTEGTGFS